jgi:hypothetical protein
MSKALPELISIALLMNKKQFAAIQKGLLLLEPKRQKALQPVFEVIKEANRVQKMSEKFAASLKKFNALHEYKRKQVAELVYDALANTTTANTIDNEIHRHYALARMLQQQMLIPLCVHHIQKAINLALEYDRWYLALELLRFKTHAVLKQPQADIEQQLKQQDKEVKLIHEKIAVYEQFSNLNNMFFVHYKKHYRVRNAKLLQTFTKLVARCKATDTAALGFDIQVLQNSIISNYNQLKGDAKTALDHELVILKLWQQHPHRIHHTPWRYAIQVNNLLQNLNAMEDYTRHPALLAELKKLYARTDNDKVMQDYELLYLELQWRMNTANFIKALQLVQQATDSWTKFRNHMSPSKSISLAYNCGVACFAAENFRKARLWFTKVIEFSRTGLRQNTRETAFLLRNIANFELGEDILLTREKIFETKLKGHNLFYKFERELYKALLKLRKFDSKQNTENIQSELQYLLGRLKTFEKQSPVKGIEGLEETKLWLQSRLGKKTMKEIMTALK